MAELGRADLHTHTSLSDGMMDVGALLEYAEQHTDVSVLAVTDHDDARPGLMAASIALRKACRLEVIVGEEITTREGHLIALFIEETIPRLQSLEASLKAIHEQGGIAIIPHPLSWLTFSVGRNAIKRVATSAEPGVYIDAIETENPTLAGKVVRDQVIALNRELGLPEVGASDAHFLPCVATGYTTFPGRTAADLRDAIKARETTAASSDFPYRAVGYRLLLQQQVQSLVIHPARQVREAVRGYRGRTGEGAG